MKKKSLQAFRDRPFNLGSFLSIGSPVVTEIAAQYPLQWLLLDMEHGGFAEGNISEHLRILAGTDVLAIVRVPSADPVVIGRVLDEGADGIMIPHMQNAEQARNCVQAMNYPPHGHRGFSSSTRQFGYGIHAPTDVGSLEKPLLIAQIEDVEGVLHAKEIADVEGIDVLFVGPADLKLALKHQTNTGFTYDESVALVAGAAKEYNKQAGILIRDASLMPDLRTSGYGCIAMDSDIAMLRRGYEKLLVSI